MPLQYFLESYHKLENIRQAVRLLNDLGDTAKVIAGGTDLLPRRPGGSRFNMIRHLIDISGLALNYVNKTADGVHIGAATDINSIAGSPHLGAVPYKALAEAAGAHSTVTIRNRATIGGNLCNASPCADLALPLLALSAAVIIAGPNGNRTLPLERFFTGPNCTALQPGEILMEVFIPVPKESTGTSFLKLRHHQTAVDMAVVNVATQLTAMDGRCLSAKIAIGAAGPTSFLAKKAASLLCEKILDKTVIRQAARRSADASAPISDIRGSAAYRREMVAVLVENSLEKSLQRIRK